MRHLISALVLSVLLVACTAKKSAVSSMSPQEAAGMLRNGFAVVLDVREEHEVRSSGLAQGAQWIPMSKIQNGAPEWRALLAEMAGKEQKLAIYCASGRRSQSAAELAAAAGVAAVNIGGFSAWQQAGLPVDRQLPGAAAVQK